MTASRVAATNQVASQVDANRVEAMSNQTEAATNQAEPKSMRRPDEECRGRWSVGRLQVCTLATPGLAKARNGGNQRTTAK